MNHIKNMRLRSMILAMVSGGLLLSAYFGYLSISRVNAERHAALVETRVSANLGHTATLTRALQRERGASAAFLTSGGAEFQREIVQLRAASDLLIGPAEGAISDLAGIIQAPESIAHLAEVQTLLDRLPRMRTLVDGLSLEPADQVAFFTQLTHGLIKMTNLAAVEMASPESAQALLKIVALQDALDTAGVERAVGAGGFAISAFDAARTTRMQELWRAQDASLEFVSSLSTVARSKDLHQARFSGKSLELLSLREAIVAGDTAVFERVSGQAWFDLATDRMQRIGAIENALWDGLNERLALVRQDSTRVLALQGGTFAVVFLATIFVSGLIYRALMGQFQRATHALRDLADGKLDTYIPAERPNEFGEIARTLVIFRESELARQSLKAEAAEKRASQQHVVAEMSVALGRMANGDLRTRITTPFEPDYEDLRRDLNLSAQNLSDTMVHLGRTAEQVAQGAEDMNNSASGLARRTEEQAGALAETAVSLDGLTQRVTSATQVLKETRVAVSEAQTKAETSSAVVADAMASIEEVKGSSTEISKIVDLIDDLSFQTNLLALNAGVEAARAGDAGRGFAVVAQEVRALAQRSTESANGIRSLIAESSASVDKSVVHVRKTHEVLNDILTSVTDVARQVRNVAEDSIEQSRGLNEINQGIAQIDQVTQKNQAMANQTNDTSASLSASAKALKQILGQFLLEKRKSPRDQDLPLAS